MELRISYNENGLNDIEITENIKSKINKLTIYCKNATIKLFCQPFQNLEKINITIYGEFHNIKDRFPFLKNNCNIIFSSLIDFYFNYDKNIDLDILYNLCNNLDKMKNLKYFYLFCMCETVDKNYYNNLNEKLSSLNLDGINIQIKNGVIIGESL